MIGPIPIPSVLFAAIVGMYASIINHIGPSDLVVIAGALAFTIVSVRGGRMKLLKDTNVDLIDRNKFLEEERSHDKSRIAVLEAQPNLNQHAALLQGLTELVTAHTQILQDIRKAVVPPQ